ncbi:MAG: class I SAM-dependent methyltransferase [Nitrospirota bacterium]|nr:MAG: class I SAM-dependent methyltransferase [Nitrospirota bacterium]
MHELTKGYTNGQRLLSVSGVKKSATGTGADLVSEATGMLVNELERIDRMITIGDYSPDNVIKDIENAIGKFITEAKKWEAGTDDISAIREERTNFHNNTNHIISKSYFLSRARTWPQGYQGDHKTLETVYRDMPLSDGIGYFLDLIALNSTLAKGVRNRLKTMQSILKKELEVRSGPEVLNIGCGSCRELFDLVPEIKGSNAKVICVDNDQDALNFAHSRFYYTDAPDNIEFRKYNALRLFDIESAEAEFGPQDIIYSMGLFDYLDSDFLAKMFNTLFSLLKPGGKLIAAFKDAKRYNSQTYHWLADWDGFKQRTEKDFLSILAGAGIDEDSIKYQRDETEAILFYEIEKK